MIHPASQVTAFPWCLWRSDAGRWWATRTRPFDREAERAGACRTVDGDDALAVCREIARQESVAALAGEE